MVTEIINPWKKDRVAFGVLGAAIGLYGVMMGVLYRVWLPSVVLPLLGLGIVTLLGMHRPYVVLNEEGITVRFLLVSRFVSWAQFHQAGLCMFENKKTGGISIKFYKLGLLMPDCIPKKPGQRFDYRKNLGRVVYLPDTHEIRDYVIQHYGLLDFDERDDPKGYSIVID